MENTIVKTLDLEQAAKFLGMHKQTLREKAAAKIIPGCKPAKCWRFIEEDLVEYMRSMYVKPASQGVKHRGNNLWRSAKEITSGGLTSCIKDNEYEKALGLITK